MHEEKKSGPGYLSGLAAGLLFGAVAGLLLAPKRGRELREELAQEAETLKERAKNIGESVSTAAQDVKVHGAEMLSTAKTAGNMLKEEAAGHVATVAQDVKSHGVEVLNTAKTAGNMLKEEAVAQVGSIKASVSHAAENLKSEAKATAEEAKAVASESEEPTEGDPGHNGADRNKDSSPS